MPLAHEPDWPGLGREDCPRMALVREERRGRWTAMVSTQVDPHITEGAHKVARGLIRTKRAAPLINVDHGMLRLGCLGGDSYWVSLDGRRVLRGEALFEANEL